MKVNSIILYCVTVHMQTQPYGIELTRLAEVLCERTIWDRARELMQALTDSINDDRLIHSVNRVNETGGELDASTVSEVLKQWLSARVGDASNYSIMERLWQLAKTKYHHHDLFSNR